MSQDQDGNVTPLPDRPRARGAPRGKPFEPANQAAATHGAFTPQLVSSVARDIIAAQLARPSCPRRLVEDPDDELLELWGTSMAVCRLLTASLTTGNVEAALTEQLSEDETTVRPAMGTAERSMRAKRRQPVLDALHKHQSQAMHLAKALGLDDASRRAAGEGQSATVDYARYWAARAEQKAREAEGSAG